MPPSTTASPRSPPTPGRARRNKSSVTSADLARAYDCTDIDGTRPDSWAK